MSRRAKRLKSGNAPLELSQSSLLDLPLELLEHILSYLGGKQWNSLRLVCSRVRDIVDQSSVWKRTCIALANVPPAMSSRWQLLLKRRIAALDFSDVQCSQKQLEKILSVLPHLRHLRLRANDLFNLAHLECHGLMDHITTLGITDNASFRIVSWAPFVMVNLKGLSKLSIHSFQAEPTRLINELAKLKKLEFLDVEFAAHTEQDAEVDSEDLASMLYSLTNLTSLRLHNIAFDSEDGDSPFDPRTCPAKLGISSDSSLQLTRLDLRVLFTIDNEESDYNQLRTSDLKHMPQLHTLRYTLCQTYMDEVMDIDTDMWNFVPYDETLEELHIHFDRGTKHSGRQFGWLVRLPRNLKCLSLQGNIPPFQPVLTGVGATLGTTLLHLRLRTFVALSGSDLYYIAIKFVKLRSLTCGIFSDTSADVILKLSSLPHFEELRLTSFIDEGTIRTVKDNMKKHFIITTGV